MGGVTLPAWKRPAPEGQALSSNAGCRHALPRSLPEASNFHVPSMRSGVVLVTSTGVSGKLTRPGVPPTSALTVQDSAGGLAVFSSRLANETPEPSGPAGQSPSTP